MLSTILFDSRLTPAAAAAALLGALIGVTGTLLVTIVNGLVGRNQHRREKIWERRQEACSLIVGALRAAKPWAERIDEGFSEDPHRYYSSDALRANHAGYRDMIAKADEAFKANYLILPRGFRARYERLTSARRGWDFDAGPDVYLGPIGENRRATQDLMDIALSSLGIVPWWEQVAISLRWARNSVTRGWGRLWRTRRWMRQRRKPVAEDFDL